MENNMILNETQDKTISEIFTNNLIPKRGPVPSQDDSVYLLFSHNDKDLHIEIYPDGESGYIITKDKKTLANEDVRNDEVVDIIKNFLELV